MSLTMYTNTSDNRYITKTITQIGETPISCTFKDDVSMETPIIYISPSEYSASCNYVYLSDTSRYYYVTDVVFSQQRVELALKVDVLMSFASSIRNARCSANRSSSDYNKYFMDNDITALSYPEYYVKNFPNSLDKTLNYILVLGG